MHRNTVAAVSALLVLSAWLFQSTQNPLQLRATIFDDVDETHPYKKAVAYMVAHGFMQGYEDGSFRPQSPVNRAEFSRVVVEAAYPRTSGDVCMLEMRKSAPESAPFFPDVPQGSWFEKYVCVALVYDLLTGYDDHTFKPSRTINVAEASKVLVLAFGMELAEGAGKQWYVPYTETLVHAGAMPKSVLSPNSFLTRAELAEMIYRLREGVTDAPAIYSAEAFHEAAAEPNEAVQGMYDLINSVRADMGLSPLRYSSQLEAAALYLAKDMYETGNFNHVSSDGLVLEQRVFATGYLADAPFYNLSENLGSTNGSSQLVFDLWIASPLHRTNMLSPLYRDMGVANVGTFWVAVFGSRLL